MELGLERIPPKFLSEEGARGRSGEKRGKISKNFPTGSAGGNESRKVNLRKIEKEKRTRGGVFNVVWPLPREEGEMGQSG